MPIGDVQVAVAGAKALGFMGLSVTMPFKSEVASCMDSLSEDADLLGAVNTVVFSDAGISIGETTDGSGFLDSIEMERSFDPEGMRAVVLGAGGAARAVILALARAGATEVVVLNRSAERGHKAALLAGEVGRLGTAADVEAADLVVNATPVGMGTNSEPYLIDPSDISAGQLAVDLVYLPQETEFLRAAGESGADTLGGLGMLVFQAARAFTLWTGVEAPVLAMRKAAEEALSSGADTDR